MSFEIFELRQSRNREKDFFGPEKKLRKENNFKKERAHRKKEKRYMRINVNKICKKFISFLIILFFFHHPSGKTVLHIVQTGGQFNHLQKGQILSGSTPS